MNTVQKVAKCWIVALVGMGIALATGHYELSFIAAMWSWICIDAEAESST